MRLFDIRFIGPSLRGSRLGNAARRGRLTIGTEIEEFESFIGFWSPRDYEEQWIEGAERVATLGKDSCLLTSVADPQEAEHLRWWLLYPRDDQVVLQEALLLVRTLPRPFSTENPYELVPAHRAFEEDGRAISEWLVPRAEVAAFAREGLQRRS